MITSLAERKNMELSLAEAVGLSLDHMHTFTRGQPWGGTIQLNSEGGKAEPHL
jgi:hypothetical protein